MPESSSHPEIKNPFLKEFLQAPLTQSERDFLQSNLTESESSASFAGLPGFGTGGMRATVALGSNHLNRYVIARLNLALGKILSTEFPGGKVVIGYDSRLTSVEFSRIAYHILKSFGMQVKVFKRVVPTPMVSFAIRELKAHSGIVITASHNPPEYNGFKVYWNDGAQIISPYDKNIEALFKQLSFADVPEQVHHYAETKVEPADLIEEEITAAYLERLKKEAFVTTGEKKKAILYSPLHGTGGWIFERAFAELNFKNFSIIASQKEPDGNFPATKSANPEDKIAFEALVAEGLKKQIPTLIATDPDADRVGVAVLKNKDYHFLTGNQIGSLLLQSIGAAQRGKDGYICKTIVTTELQKRIADDMGFETIETLTGFKFIAEVVGNDPERYIFGGEESYGYLPVPWVRDKDSLSAAVALAELAENSDLLESLDQLHLKYGIYTERLHNVQLSANGTVSMQQIMGKFENPAELLHNALPGYQIFDVLDLRKSGAVPKSDRARHLKSTLPAADVIQYWLEPEGRLTIRPSGTEPKIKIYLSIRTEPPSDKSDLPGARQAADNKADQLLSAFLKILGL
ncbi:MAG: phospho-sugar mutase [Leptospiraceae bacterium]|nr:phospho-sugar mutase [Leptospiraceae bacterium]